jgi:hypothetical protein
LPAPSSAFSAAVIAARFNPKPPKNEVTTDPTPVATKILEVGSGYPNPLMMANPGRFCEAMLIK